MSQVSSTPRYSPGSSLLGHYSAYEPTVGYPLRGPELLQLPSPSSRYAFSTSRHLGPAPQAGRRSESSSRALVGPRVNTNGVSRGLLPSCLAYLTVSTFPLSSQHHLVSQSAFTQDLVSMGLSDQPPRPASRGLIPASAEHYSSSYWVSEVI